MARERLLMWRLMFWALVAGAAFSLTGGFLFPHQPGERLVGLAIAAVCVLGAGGLWMTRGRLSPWIAHPIMASATVAISAEIYTNSRISNDDELFYLWVTVFAFYFFTRRQALAHMALIGVGYWMAIFLRDDAAPDDRLRWLVTIITLTVAGLVIQHLTRRQAETIEQLSEAIREDPLTGLLNRKGFQEAFARALARAQRRGDGFAVIIGDLDRFKQVNDRLGHAAGDAALTGVAALLSAATRGGDRPARLGGEEFAVLAADADAAQGVATAERLRKAIEEDLATSRMGVTISFGVAVYPRDGTTADQLMRAADRALYAAKRNGRNRTVAHHEISDRPH